jgi:hypothetical protein
MSNYSSKLRLAAALIGAALAMAPGSAAQAAICAPRPSIVDALKSKFSEQQNGVGIVNTETVVELFVSVEGSWTMLTTNVTGISCIVGSGTSWQGVVPPNASARAS